MHLPGRMGGGTTGGCTIPLMGSSIGSSLGSGSGLEVGVDICKARRIMPAQYTSVDGDIPFYHSPWSILLHSDRTWQIWKRKYFQS